MIKIPLASLPLLASFVFILLVGTCRVTLADWNSAEAARESGDYEAAFIEYSALAEQGHTIAQYRLGMMFANGISVPEDETEAVKWYRLSAEQGYAPAQNSLGYMYNRGYGVIEDDGEAAKWYQRAAEQGHRMAQLSLQAIQSESHGISSNSSTFTSNQKSSNSSGMEIIEASNARARRDRLLSEKMEQDKLDIEALEKEIMQSDMTVSATYMTIRDIRAEIARGVAVEDLAINEVVAKNILWAEKYNQEDIAYEKAMNDIKRYQNDQENVAYKRAVEVVENSNVENMRAQVNLAMMESNKPISLPPEYGTVREINRYQSVSRDVVLESQRLLTSLGYSLGSVDGLSGRKTKAAVREFQSDLELTATGDISDELLMLLRLAVKASASGVTKPQ